VVAEPREAFARSPTARATPRSVAGVAPVPQEGTMAPERRSRSVHPAIVVKVAATLLVGAVGTLAPLPELRTERAMATETRSPVSGGAVVQPAPSTPPSTVPLPGRVRLGQRPVAVLVAAGPCRRGFVSERRRRSLRRRPRRRPRRRHPLVRLAGRRLCVVAHVDDVGRVDENEHSAPVTRVDRRHTSSGSNWREPSGATVTDRSTAGARERWTQMSTTWRCSSILTREHRT
jgi:hypothetical protein